MNVFTCSVASRESIRQNGERLQDRPRTVSLGD